MIVSFIAAMDKERVIGKNNSLPWHLPADLKYFREKTSGKPVIMGRKTYESIGKPMPNRINIIVTRNQNYKAEGCITVHSADEALKKTGGHKEVMVIGGAQIYRELFPKANRLYLTKIDAEFEGDTFFPEFVEDEWKLVSKEEHKANKENPYDYVFLVYERKS